jgi:dTDP-4-amino-4,6-dideoxygalactose transaminase
MIPLVDLKAQYRSIKPEIDSAVEKVMESGNFILGSEVESFEKEITDYLDIPYAVGVASGTDALRLTLLACRVGPTDEVITTPFTFVATVEVIIQCGAKPVFADINPYTFNIDTDKIEDVITLKTKAILPVHLYGNSCNMDAIMDLAYAHNLDVIEDCAQALGSDHKGRKVGTFGTAGCFSFFPSKTLGCYGDGGLVTTKDKRVADKIKLFRNHGSLDKRNYEVMGFNSRLDELQVAILRVKLRYLDKWLLRRREIASMYSQLLGLHPSNRLSGHSFNYYTIRVKERDKLKEYLSERGIQTAIYYPMSLHLQPVYKYLGYKEGDFPESEKASKEVLSLPMYPELRDEDIERIVDCIKTSKLL